MTISADRLTDYEQQLASENPLRELRNSVAHQLHEEHVPRDEVLRRLDTIRRELRAAGREEDEDIVMDVMDFVVGWCSPRQRL